MFFFSNFSFSAARPHSLSFSHSLSPTSKPECRRPISKFRLFTNIISESEATWRFWDRLMVACDPNVPDSRRRMYLWTVGIGGMGKINDSGVDLMVRNSFIVDVGSCNMKMTFMELVSDTVTYNTMMGVCGQLSDVQTYSL